MRLGGRRASDTQAVAKTHGRLRRGRETVPRLIPRTARRNHQIEEIGVSTPQLVVLNDVLGTKFKLVTGYLGSQETILAIERGEAHGRCVFSYSALKIAKPGWLREKKINVLVLTALEPHPDFPGVPAVVQLATRAEDRQLLELMIGPSAMGRPFAAPPGLPAEKTALLRRAFDATVQDPEFRAEAAKLQADLAPTTGEMVQQLVVRIYATPKPVIARAKRLFTP